MCNPAQARPQLGPYGRRSDKMTDMTDLTKMMDVNNMGYLTATDMKNMTHISLKFT